MARIKRLNIGNTDKHFNVNLMKRKDIEDKTMIHRLNEDDIEEQMDYLADKSRRIPLRDGKEYIIFQEKYTNDKMIRKVIAHGGSVSYYTNTIVPYYVLEQLAQHTSSEAIYAIQSEYTDEQIENIELAYMATRVVIDCPVIMPDMSPYDLLFALHDLKTDVDQVQLSFPPLREITDRHKEYYQQIEGLYHVKPKYKYQYFKYIQNSLSLWKMNIWIVADNNRDYQALEKMVNEEKEKRSPKKKKKAGAKK